MDRQQIVDLEFLSGIPLFSKLSREDLAKLAHLWKPITREAGKLVFRKGEPSQTMYLIREGKVAITVWSEDNQEITLAVLHEGDFLGELGMFDPAPRTANAKVIENTVLLEMGRDDFLNFLLSKPEVSITLARLIAERLRITNAMVEQRATRNVNEVIEQRLDFGDRISDKIARFGGSWTFIIIFMSCLLAWMVINTVQIIFKSFDPFPYIFLNLVLSCVAAVQAPVILMSQNRQAENDRLRSELDYQINLKAEMQIQGLHVKIDELRTSEIHELCELQREQMKTLQKQIDLLDRMLNAKS